MLSLTTSTAGSFSTYLPDGNYTASVDLRTTELNQTKERYVRYTGSLTFDSPPTSADKDNQHPQLRQLHPERERAVGGHAGKRLAGIRLKVRHSAMSTTATTTPSGLQPGDRAGRLLRLC